MSHLLSLAGGETSLLAQELTWVALVSIAALVAIIVRRIRLPYTVALVLVGLLLTFSPSFGEIIISSDLILALLVPPLLFEATLHVKWDKLRLDLIPILLLALVGSLLGTFIVGGAVAIFLDIPWPAAIAFGALISATDPVAVIAFFRSLGVSKRLAILVEGESLFNDGVAIVIFTIALSLADVHSTGFSLTAALGTFVQIAFGGLFVGLTLGYIVSSLILKNVDDHLIETTTTVALAFGAYVVAEDFGGLVGIEGLHFSGILAVVAAGLMVGNIGSQNTSPTTKLALDNFWELLAFVVNSLVFLVIGLEINITELGSQLPAIFLAVAVSLASRAIVVYTLTWFNNQINPRRHIPLAFRHIMNWGGLRGAISLALALTLSTGIGGHAPDIDPDVVRQLQLMTFGVVLFTLIVQGTTIARLIQYLGLSQKPNQLLQQQRQQAILYARRAGQEELDRLHHEGLFSDNIWHSVRAVYDAEINNRQHLLHNHLEQYPELERALLLQVRQDLLRAERTALNDAARRGLIGEEILHQLIRELNERTAALNLAHIDTGITHESMESYPPITSATIKDGLNCIVVATRGGEGSRAVKSRGIQLAKATGARLIFFYVVDISSVRQDFDDNLAPALTRELHWLGAALLHLVQIRAQNEGVTAEIALREGELRPELHRFLQESQADLLLIGAPRGTTTNTFGDDAVEQFALAMEELTGIRTEIVRPEQIEIGES
ncbi:MAG TPA: Na+/H+ antiporter [Anaerolineae bacterium]|nr:Na+/H+ antiporter [Anaerolineae bacterium]